MTAPGALEWMPRRSISIAAGASVFCMADQALAVEGGLASLSVFFLKSAQDAASTVSLVLWTAPVGFARMDTPIPTVSAARASLLALATEPVGGLGTINGTAARVYGARLAPAQALGTLLFWELRAAGNAAAALTGSIYVVANHVGRITAPKVARSMDASRFFLMGPAARGCDGCRTPGCPACEAAGIARCPCEDPACRGCGAVPRRAPDAREFEEWLASRAEGRLGELDLDPRILKDLVSAFGARQTRWRSVKEALDALRLVESGALLSRSIAYTLDAHAHFVAPTWTEALNLYNYRNGSFKSLLDGQLSTVDSGDLTAIMLAPNPYYEDHIAEVFGGDGTFEEDTSDSYMNSTWEMGLASMMALEYAYDTYGYPAYLPMVMVPHWDLQLDDTPAIVRWLLSTGNFVGIGEVLVHGHGMDLEVSEYKATATNEYLEPLVRLAALYDVPLLLHWDFGSVDSGSVDADGADFTAEDSYDQLVELLEYAAEGFARRRGRSWPGDEPGVQRLHEAKIIIAHGGGGPDSPGWKEETRAELETYTENVAALLEAFPNVYFDISGINQFWTEGGSATPYGSALLSLIAAWPERFLFGLDETAPSSDASDELIDYESYLASDATAPVDLDALYWSTPVEALTAEPSHFE